MSFFGGRKQQTEDPTSSPVPSSRPQAPANEPPPPPRQPVGFETVLGSRTTLTGDFRGKGNARLDGILEGTLEIDGNVLIGDLARITADIHARNISIAGAVRGNVHGNKVQILRTGRVWGDINAAAITTEEGAFIDGKIAMVSHQATLQGLEAPDEPEVVLEEPLEDMPVAEIIDDDDDAAMDDLDKPILIGEEETLEEEDDIATIDLVNPDADDDDDQLPVDEDGAVG